MAKELVVSGYLQAGVLTIRNRKQMDAVLARWKDCEITVTVEKAHATRSLEQNALYWVAYVNPLAEYTGYSPKWMHAYLKKRFLPSRRLLIQDKHGVVVDERDLEALTTTTLNKVEFGEYLHAIEEFALELGVDVGPKAEDAA